MNRRYFKFCGGTHPVSRSVGFSLVGASRDAPFEMLLIFQTLLFTNIFTSIDNFVSPVPVSDWSVVLCCGNLNEKN